jgi:hypothetical protein
MCAVQAAFLTGDPHHSPEAPSRYTMLPRWMVFDSMTVDNHAQAGAAHLMGRALCTVGVSREFQSHGLRLAWDDARLLRWAAYG